MCALVLAGLRRCRTVAVQLILSEQSDQYCSVLCNALLLLTLLSAASTPTLDFWQCTAAEVQ
jgi:hypothetical protein